MVMQLFPAAVAPMLFFLLESIVAVLQEQQLVAVVPTLPFALESIFEVLQGQELAAGTAAAAQSHHLGVPIIAHSLAAKPVLLLPRCSREEIDHHHHPYRVHRENLVGEQAVCRLYPVLLELDFPYPYLSPSHSSFCFVLSVSR